MRDVPALKIVSGDSTHISLDESRLSLSRVRRGYCSRTSPIDRETRIASRRGASALYIPLYVPEAIPTVTEFQESGRYALPHWLPPHVRYHESVLSCTVLRISLAPSDCQPPLSHFSRFFFFFSISLSILC